jgi:hypothetical protein
MSTSRRAAAVAAHRAREAAGRVLLTIECDEVDLEEALKAAGLLAPDADSHEATEAALQRLVEAIIADHLAACNR